MSLEEETTGSKTPTISVVIPTYNRASCLPRSIRSVLAQTYQDFEIIVVDDASADDTESVVAAFDDPRIRYVRHERNLGGSAARNTGIKAARGSLIAFQDSDDEWLSEKLEKQIRFVNSQTVGEKIVYCSYIRTNDGSVAIFPEAHIRVKQGLILPALLKGNFVGTPTLIVPRTCFEKVGYFDERLGRLQDWELVIRLATEFEFVFVDEPLVVAHQTPGSITSDNTAAIEALEVILEKHRQIFAEFPTHLAAQLKTLGRMKCLAGFMSEGRAYLLDALKTQPFSWGAWKVFLPTVLGVRGYRLLAAADLGSRRLKKPRKSG